MVKRDAGAIFKNDSKQCTPQATIQNENVFGLISVTVTWHIAFPGRV